MADLDDFFAKKDRKKSKGKKVLTSEELTKKLDDKKVDTKPKKEKPMSTISEGGVQEPVSISKCVEIITFISAI
jgi:predicted nucleotidyltransferase component of viral defense system